MIRIRTGEVVAILEAKEDILIASVLVEGEKVQAVHYPLIGGPLHVGQRVVLNTTARQLQLGTGGQHFVMYAEGNDQLDAAMPGHIMKMRYTPYQIKVLSVEEEVSPYHGIIAEKRSLEAMPVVVAPLHSMLLPIIAVAKACDPDLRIAYLMSDEAAIPLALSRLVRDLRERNWLCGTVTFGHAFGGDFEAVNIYTALLTAKWVINADLAVVAMGPGIVGTGTPLGFSGVEQANFLHAVSILQGTPIAVPRISFADPRERHRGISHHSRTILGELTLVRCNMAIPELNQEQLAIVLNQLDRSGIGHKHAITIQPTAQVEQILTERDLQLQTMGRSYDEDKEFFLTAGLAGQLAREMVPEPVH